MRITFSEIPLLALDEKINTTLIMALSLELEKGP